MVWFYCFKLEDNALRCCIGFYHTTTWINHNYTHILEKAMAPHSSTLAWEIPWTEEPGRLQSMGLRRVRHDWATSLSFFTFMHWRTHSSVLAWRIPGMAEPGGLPSVGLHRVGHDWHDLTAAAEYTYTLPLESPPPNFTNFLSQHCLLHTIPYSHVHFLHMDHFFTEGLEL